MTGAAQQTEAVKKSGEQFSLLAKRQGEYRASLSQTLASLKAEAAQLKDPAIQKRIKDIATLESQNNKLKNSLTGVTTKQNLFNNALAAAGGIIATGVIIRWMSDTVKMAAEAESAINKLNAALMSQGAYTPQLSASLQAYAKDLERVTVVEDDTSLAMMGTIATLTELSEKGIKQAQQAAIGLSRTFGMDLQQAAVLVSKAIHSETNALGRYGISLGDAKTETEKANIIFEKTGRMFQIAEAETKTYSGQLAQLQNAYGNLREDIGTELLPILKKLYEVLKGHIDAFKELNPGMQTFYIKLGLVSIVALPLVVTINNLALAYRNLGLATIFASGSGVGKALGMGAAGIGGAGVAVGAGGALGITALGEYFAHRGDKAKKAAELKGLGLLSEFEAAEAQNFQANQLARQAESIDKLLKTPIANVGGAAKITSQAIKEITDGIRDLNTESASGLNATVEIFNRLRQAISGRGARDISGETAGGIGQTGSLMGMLGYKASSARDITGESAAGLGGIGSLINMFRGSEEIKPQFEMTSLTQQIAQAFSQAVMTGDFKSALQTAFNSVSPKLTEKLAGGITGMLGNKNKETGEFGFGAILGGNFLASLGIGLLGGLIGNLFGGGNKLPSVSRPVDVRLVEITGEAASTMLGISTRRLVAATAGVSRGVQSEMRILD